MAFFKQTIVVVALGLATLVQAKEPLLVEYRDGTSSSYGPFTDAKPLIPLKFVKEEDHFKVISNNGASPTQWAYKAAKFTLDGEKFEILSMPNSVFVSSKPWHPERDKAGKEGKYVARLMDCNGPNLGTYGCRVYTGRENVVVLKARSSGGRDNWSIAIDPSVWVKAKGIDLGTSARLSIEGEGISFSKNYDLKPGMLLVHRPKIEMTGVESDRVLGALSQGKAITLQLQDKAGETHSYVISSRDARMGFFIFQRVWPELKAAAECKTKLRAEC